MKTQRNQAFETETSYAPAVPIRSIRFFAGDVTLDDFTFAGARVPEPASLLLLGAGLAALAGAARARRKR